jgi:hypothetical protein
MDHKQMHQYAVTYHCGKDWGEEMVQSVDLGHAVEAAHAFPSRGGAMRSRQQKGDEQSSPLQQHTAIEQHYKHHGSDGNDLLEKPDHVVGVVATN